MESQGGQAVSQVLQSAYYGLSAGCLMFLAMICGQHLGKSRMREEAVRKGHAEWVVDCAGKNQFKWKECK
jgi:hypothetical protein